jgi:hydroxymethylpyrimidine/phosphomethylpyrimidine kinase
VQQKIVLSIAGFDPSGGAGVLADIKTLQQENVYGLSVITANTIQHESAVESVHWISSHLIFGQLKFLLKKYRPHAVKIGLIENVGVLEQVLEILRKESGKMPVIWDPILQSGSGFEFHSQILLPHLQKVIEQIDILTPNLEEMKKIAGQDEVESICSSLSRKVAVLLKSGKKTETEVEDWFFRDGTKAIFRTKRISNAEKHGTGCVYSSSLAAQLAKDVPLSQACLHAQQYVHAFLQSSNSLL